MGALPCGYLSGVDGEHWRALAERHRRCDVEPRRCADCHAYWPCVYRLRADRELTPHRAGM